MAMDISQKIKELRKAKGLSQTQLAQLIGVSQSAINYFENRGNELTISQLQKITEVMGVSWRDILSEEESPKTEITSSENEKLEEQISLGKKMLIDAVNSFLEASKHTVIHLYSTTEEGSGRLHSQELPDKIASFIEKHRHTTPSLEFLQDLFYVDKFFDLDYFFKNGYIKDSWLKEMYKLYKENR